MHFIAFPEIESERCTVASSPNRYFPTLALTASEWCRSAPSSRHLGCSAPQEIGQRLVAFPWRDGFRSPQQGAFEHNLAQFESRNMCLYRLIEADDQRIFFWTFGQKEVEVSTLVNYIAADIV